jgi:protein-tyrosine phosphatase
MVAGEGLTTRFAVESAGTGAWHEGQPADRRMRRAAGRRGITLDSVARQITADDFQRFDHIFAMDSANLRTLQSLAPPEHRDKIRLFRDADPDGPGDDVPDPYYGGADGFDEVLDIVTRTGRVWLDTLRAR